MFLAGLRSFAKKSRIIVILISFSLSVVHSYSTEVDSVWNIINSISDLKEKCRNLNDFSWKYRNKSPEFSVSLGEKAIELASKLNDSNELLRAISFTGVSYRNLGNYYESFRYFNYHLQKAREFKNIEQEVYALINIGNLYIYQGKGEDALKTLSQALNLLNKTSDKTVHGYLFLNLGRAYQMTAQNEKAIEMLMRSYQNRKLLNDRKGQGICSKYLGDAYFEMNEPEKALEYYHLSLELIDLSEDIDVHSDIFNRMAVVYLKQNKLAQAKEKALLSYNLAFRIGAKPRIKNACKTLAEIYANEGNFQKAYYYQDLHSKYHDSLFNDEVSSKIADIRFENERIQKQAEIDVLKANENRQRIINIALLIGTGMLTLLTIIVVLSLQQKKKDNKIISDEKTRSEELLLNILPSKVVKELKEKGNSAPENFEDVTVFFSDITGFTSISATLHPAELISELNEIFTAFDDIMTNNACERIKTIGDAYLAVCGMPASNPDHAVNIVKSAVEIKNYLEKRNLIAKNKWEVRIGIHSGRVVGGIVGVKKYIYDVFGDTINTASRMESNSEPMRINISENTYQLIKNSFSCKERPATEVKGKGMMKMYFVEC